MSATAGFSWGVKLGDKPRAERAGKSASPLKKRKFDEDKFKVSKVKPKMAVPPPVSHKRTKIPAIRGEKLPINRLIETLSHNSVSELLQSLVKIHPEIVHTIYEIQPKASLSDSIDVIKRKFEAIKQNLPYKGDVENDYSYLRIKPLLNEFLNCLSDFILNFLPPIEDNLMNSLLFLDYITNLINDLPNFHNNEFKYIKAKCFEQISNTWLIVLNKIYDTLDPDSPELKLFNFIKIMNDLDLKQKLSKYNQFSHNEFDKVLNFITSKFNDYEPVSESSPNDILNELISVDYSNYSLTANSSV